MILGIFVRNYKTYQNINYIPFSSGEPFCGLVGINGVGKSSILESLDTFFNNKPWIWNLASKKQGQQAKPYIVPVFLIEKSKLSGADAELAEDISRIIWSLEDKDINANNKSHFEVFKQHRDLILRNIEPKDYFLIPIGKDQDDILNFSIFNRYKLGVALGLDIEENVSIKPEDLSEHEGGKKLLKTISGLYEYLYIPQDIDPNTFVKLETHEIQVLMGRTLSEIIETTLPRQTVKNINEGLQNYLEKLSQDLEGYSFRNPTDRQFGVRKGDFYSLIIEHFFETKKLHKQDSSHWIDIKDLSSGEKQKAIIDLAHSLLTNHRGNSDNLILAIDEPESSLHISSCFEQFLRLFSISGSCLQVIFSTHWYGFFPTIDNGFVSVINRKEGQHVVDPICLSNYREDIKQKKKSTRGQLPFDIQLKSMNDFSQSIIASMMSEDPFNWIICEGSSEKIYLDYYLADLIKEKKLRVIPVGGASEIKRVYGYVTTSYEDFKNEIKGKIFMLSDTDRELVQYETSTDTNKLVCRRLINDPKSQNTVLVKINSNISSPQTEIEDCLSGMIFHLALLQFKPYNKQLEFIQDEIKSECELNSHFYLDLRQTEKESLDGFFNKGNNKWLFAKKYIEILNQNGEVSEIPMSSKGKNLTPSWINEIREFFKSGNQEK